VKHLEAVGRELLYESTNSSILAEVLELVFEEMEERFKILSTNQTLAEYMKKAEKQANEYSY
jgi:hypothetical protein